MLIPSLAHVPGQGVKVDHAAIVEILLQQLDDEREFSHYELYEDLSPF